MLAPVSFIPNYGVVISPDAPVLYAQFTPSHSQYVQKPKSKKTAPATETHRAGDWVCILCHNLNYSFRKVCNRCQVQTKRDNLIQSLSMLGKSTPQEERVEEKQRQVTPPGLSNLKEKPKVNTNSEVFETQKTQKIQTVKAGPQSLGLFAKPLATPKVTPKKAHYDEAFSTNQSTNDKWSDSPSTKDGADMQGDQDRPQLGQSRAFQLFEGSKASLKESFNLPFTAIGDLSGDLSPHGHQSEEDQQDLEIWRSIDYVLDDCRE